MHVFIEHLNFPKNIDFYVSHNALCLLAISVLIFNRPKMTALLSTTVYINKDLSSPCLALRSSGIETVSIKM